MSDVGSVGYVLEMSKRRLSEKENKERSDNKTCNKFRRSHDKICFRCNHVIGKKADQPAYQRGLIAAYTIFNMYYCYETKPTVRFSCLHQVFAGGSLLQLNVNKYSLGLKNQIFSYLSCGYSKTCKNRLNEKVLLSTQNICLDSWVSKYSKTCIKRLLKNRQNIDLYDEW